MKLDKWSAIEGGLHFLKNTTFWSQKDVIKQQISSMGVTIVLEEKYKMDTAVDRLRQDFQSICYLWICFLTNFRNNLSHTFH